MRQSRRGFFATLLAIPGAVKACKGCSKSQTAATDLPVIGRGLTGLDYYATVSDTVPYMGISRIGWEHEYKTITQEQNSNG